MAEAAGLAIGVAALFNTCVDSFKIVFAAQDFARDFEILNTRFQQQRLRLLLWGQSVGIISRRDVSPRPYLQELDSEHVRPTILRSLGSIHFLLEQFKILEDKYGTKEYSATGLISVNGSRPPPFQEIVRRNQRKKSIKALARWAVFDAEQMRDAIEQLEALIDGLVHITNELRSAIEQEAESTGTEIFEHVLPSVSNNMHPAQGIPELPSNVRRILALEMQNSVETFHTAQELIGSIETFETARGSTLQSLAFFTAEELQSDLSDRQEEDSRNDISLQAQVVPTFEPPIRPANRGQVIMPSVDNTYPSTPHDFTEHFPTDEKILITHEDGQLDTNMNLRMSVWLPSKDDKRMYRSLFHLRMHNLHDRVFSLRRYYRASGREICHSGLRGIAFRESTRSTAMAGEDDDIENSRERTPSTPSSLLSRSLTQVNTLSKKSLTSIARLSAQSLRSTKLFTRRSSTSSFGSNASSASSYGLEQEDAEEDEWASPTQVVAEQKSRKSIVLEFANYARVDLQRRGRKQHKRYCFAYWGQEYTWKRSVDGKKGGASDCYGHSLHLYRTPRKEPIAHIEPVRGVDVAGEGWIPPCSLQFAHPESLRDSIDVADVVVATGVVALVDNAIRSYLTVISNGEVSLPRLVIKSSRT